MNICVFGDSVTFAGYIKNSWANLLRWQFESLRNEYYEVFNLGVSGDTSVDILKRLPTEAAARAPDQIVFAFGVNDSAYIFDTHEPLVTESDFTENVQTLIQQAKTFTNNIVFIGLVLGDDSILKPFPGSSKGNSYDHERVKRYDQILKTVAIEHKCLYIDLSQALSPDDFDDGLHPNEIGHQKMFQVIKSNLPLTTSYII